MKLARPGKLWSLAGDPRGVIRTSDAQNISLEGPILEDGGGDGFGHMERM